MRKFIPILLFVLTISSLMAQPAHKSSNNSKHQPRHTEQRFSVQFSASHGEDFYVYVDGDRVAARTQRGLLKFDIQRGQHEIVVLLNRPADKVATFVFEPQDPNTSFEVSYNGREKSLEVFLRTQRGTELVNGQVVGPMAPVPPAPPAPPVNPGVAQPQVPTNGEMIAITERIRKESFENDRVAMAKEYVSTHWLNASQIKLIANTLSFENNKLEFLMYAYNYCVDPEHYGITEEILQFQSNRNSLREFLRSKR